MATQRGKAATVEPRRRRADRRAGDPPAANGGTGTRAPRTARGERTLRALLDAAATEFGERGFHEGSISGITSRAGVALGSFYTYFDSKDAIFRALLRDISGQVRDRVAPALTTQSDPLAAERAGVAAFLQFTREHRELYRIVDEAEFVDPEGFRAHYENTASRIQERLRAAAEQGSVRPDVGELHAWAYMGMNVFLGMRYSLWDDSEDSAAIAERANDLLVNGIARRD